MRLATISFVVLLFGCSPYVHSPAGRTFPLEAPKALNPRETGVQVEGGWGFGEYVNRWGLTARVRHGLVKGLDGNAEFGYQRVRVSSNGFQLPNPNIYTGRLGIKYAPIDHVALAVGLAGGGWTGGGFISPDVSLIVGYENPYCVPFFDIGGYGSIPVHEKIITIPGEGVSGNEDYIAAPVNTAGWTVGAGVRIPISHVKDASTKSAFLVGVRFRGAHFHNGPLEIDDRRTYFFASGAFEYVFGAPNRSR
mgnify:FL=1